MNQKSSCNFWRLVPDVNFGELTRMFNHLNELEGVSIHFNHEVRTLKQRKDKTWRITDLATGQKKESVQFVFIGAGGGLPLLEKQMFQKEKVWRFPRK
jgi:malate dehydrogenase (quinone)